MFLYFFLFNNKGFYLNSMELSENTTKFFEINVKFKVNTISIQRDMDIFN